MPYRSRKEDKKISKHFRRVKLSGICEFCEINKQSTQYIEESDSFIVMRNIFPYSLWDHRKVADHLMIIPKRHTDTLDEISDKQAAEYVRLLGTYESRGYDVYARAPLSKMKSVEHQHTHLIKIDTATKLMKFLLFVHKPYIRITR